MTLKSQMLGDVSTVFLDNDEHGEPVQYRERSGDFTDYTAIVDRAEQLGATQARDGIAYLPTCSVHMATDGTNGPSTFHEGDAVRIAKVTPVTTFPTDECDYETWYVAGIPSDDGAGLKNLELSRTERREVSTQTFRNRRR